MNDQEYRRHILEVLRQPLGRVFSTYNLPHVLALVVLTGLTMEEGASGLHKGYLAEMSRSTGGWQLSSVYG